MKKILIINLGLLLAAVIANAQTAGGNKTEIVLEGGVKADATFLNFQKTGAPGAVSTFTPGFTPGGFMNIWFNDWIGIRPELNLNFKQTVLGWIGNSGKLQSFGVEIPIYVTGRINIFGEDHVFIGIGPYTEFICYGKWSIDNRKVDLLEIHTSGEPMIQDTQSGLGAIVGYEFGMGLSIDFSYKICCYNILQPNTSQGVSLYPQTISVGLAYKWGKR
jgi:hypothetical protein